MSRKRKVLQGSASNLTRVLLSMLVALVLPPFLVHRMSHAEYSAWVLILQLSAYVNILDLGLQTAVGKFVAEYDAVGDRAANRRVVSTSFTALLGAGLLGSGLVAAIVWRVPQLFHQMPPALVPEVRTGLLCVGLSTAFALPFNPFLAVFTGLQRYGFPTAVAATSRIASAIGLLATLLLHGSLVQLALVMAGFNVATAIAQWLGWKKYASDRAPFSFLWFDRNTAVRLAKYASVLSIWTLGMFFVSGLDTIIVGHFDYRNTGFYAIAASATSFLLAVVSSAFSPLIPAVSSMQASSTPSQIGELTIKTTRYCSLLLCLLGLPLLIAAYPLLRLWVGRDYAAHAALFLEVLVVGNAIRQLAFPYVLVVVATGKQHLATIAAIAETIVNFALSVWLAQRMGAIGVAIGTLIGAFVSVGMHLTVSMHYTQSTILIRRSRLFWEGLLRPLSSVAPSLLLYPFWKRGSLLPFQPVLLCVWVIATAAILWQVGLTGEERRAFRGGIFRLASWRLGRI